MSVLGDALTAIRNVVLMQERMEVMNRKVDRLADDVKGLNDYVLAVDKRVIRIETMTELSRSWGSPTPRIEE